MEFCLQKVWYFGKYYQWNLNLGLYFPHFKFKPLYVHNWSKQFLWNEFTFDQQYLNTGLRTQNGEKSCQDLTIFAEISKGFWKQNSMLRIQSKPTEFKNWQELSVCICHLITKLLHDPSHKWMVKYDHNDNHSIYHLGERTYRHNFLLLHYYLVPCSERWKLLFKWFLAQSSIQRAV